MRILILQPMLKHYRVPFFERLASRLAEEGHELRVVCGDPPPADEARRDNCHIDAAWCFFPGSLWLFGQKAHWLRGVWEHLQWADLIITEQANKHLHNYLALLLREFGNKRLAWWGHGRNLQGSPCSLREWLKRSLATYCDWWFAYTEGVAKYISGLGFPRERITVVNNSIDTTAFEHALGAVTEEDVAALRGRLGINGKAVALYCGGLYSDKRIPFLLDAAETIKEALGGFDLIVVGDGPDASKVKKAAERRSWIHYVGPIFGDERAVYFRASDVMLMPGLVGLAIVDCFLAGVPLITTDIPIHSPEIAYLESGRNGVMTRHDSQAYARTVIDLFRDNARLARLKKGCLESAGIYTLDKMVESFAQGVEECLGGARS